MPTYLLHQTGDGVPIGVYTATRDFYTPDYSLLRAEGREVVYSQLPTVSWEDFIERLASTSPSRTMRWDTFYDPSPNLEDVLYHAFRDLETTGVEEPE